MLYQLSAALILVCATGTLGHAQAWHERGCDAPPIGRDTFVLARAGRPTLPPSRAALVVFASVRDSTTDTPLNGFAAWLARPDSLGSYHFDSASRSDSLPWVRLETEQPGAYLVRVRRIAFRELRAPAELRLGFTDTLYAHLRTDRVCLRGIRPDAH